MSISILSALSSAAMLEQSVEKAEKDAQQKASETAASGAFASVLAQANGGNDVTMITGHRGNAVIPAILIDLGPDDPAGTQSAAIVSAADRAGDATEAFLDFAHKSPAQKLRAMVLSELGLTDDALKQLDAETRAAVEEKIKIRIEAKVRRGIEESAGMTLGQSSTAALRG